MDNNTVYKKINDIVREAPPIKKFKHGTNQGETRSIDEVLAVYNLIMVKHGLIMIPETIEEKIEISIKNPLYIFKIKWKLVDIENGHFIYFESIGAGSNSLEKGAGSAMTYALKYAMTSLFRTSQNDSDPDMQKPTKNTVDNDHDKIKMIVSKIGAIINKVGLVEGEKFKLIFNQELGKRGIEFLTKTTLQEAQKVLNVIKEAESNLMR